MGPIIQVLRASDKETGAEATLMLKQVRCDVFECMMTNKAVASISCKRIDVGSAVIDVSFLRGILRKKASAHR